MRRAGEQEAGGQRSSHQGTARSISATDRLVAVGRETCFRFGRRAWAYALASHLLQALFVLQVLGLSVSL